MTTCLGKSCLFGFLYVSFVNVYYFVCDSFPFGFEFGMWDFVMLIPNHCLSIYFSLFLDSTFIFIAHQYKIKGIILKCLLEVYHL